MTEPHDSQSVSILLVDDQPARLLSYELILRGLGHELVSAASGPEALEKLLKQEFAVILLDVSMPGMDGFELAGLIHEHPRFEKTPIIFATGLHVTDLDRLKGYEIGAVDYVYVPVVPEILRSKVSVFTELYLKRRELQDLNRSLEQTNVELFAANTSLQAEKARELEAANEKLTETNQTLKHEIAERRRLEGTLVEADRKKDEFLAMLAHELRNPLAPILNTVQLLRMRALEDPELAWCHDVIGRQTEHLTRLVDDLLDVSRISQGKIRLQRTDVALHTVVSRAIETNRPFIDARGHQLAVDLPAHPVHVFGDLTRLAQVVGNLINNAANYTDAGGSIRVSLEIARSPEGADEALIRVNDTGIGIPSDMLPRVFELFTQVERPTDRAQAGLGIGLALVRRLVELHGGRVEAFSQGHGMGSEFVVALPLQAGFADAVAESAPDATPAVKIPISAPIPVSVPIQVSVPMPVPAPVPVQGPSRRPRILVIDDNQDSATSMALLLSRMGYEVEVALDGLEGLRTVSDFDPDIVFLDLGMPAPDGYEVARRIRALPRGEARTLVALTGYGQAEDRRRTREAGFDHHLVKPLERKDLDDLLRLASTAPRPVGGAGVGQRTPVAAESSSPERDRRRLWMLPAAVAAAGAIWGLQGGLPWWIAVAIALVATAAAVRLARGSRSREELEVVKPVEPVRGALAKGFGSAPTPEQAVPHAGVVASEPPASRRSKATGSGRPLLEELEDVAADVPAQIEALRAAVERGSAADMQVSAHRLKGSSRLIGASALAAVASEIERLASTGDASAVGPLLADLEKAWPATREALHGETEPATAG